MQLPLMGKVEGGHEVHEPLVLLKKSPFEQMQVPLEEVEFVGQGLHRFL